MEITTEAVKELRDRTGISVMQCKKALEEAGGDMEKAIVILRKIAAAGAGKKSDRALGAGIAAAYTHAGGQVVGAIVLGCETDFVARNPEFGKMAYDIAMHVAAMQPEFISKESVKESDIAKAREVFQEGQAVSGTVYKFNPFGAYINLDHGLQGMIHVSEFGGPEEMKQGLSAGASYTFRIESIRPEEKRIVLKLQK